MIEKQLSWDNNIKNEIWINIIKNKIYLQEKLLKRYIVDNIVLTTNDIDITNIDIIEANRARTYFSNLFYKDFRRREDNDINKYLNYSYSIIASNLTRELHKYSLIIEIGIHHINNTNSFNLTYDLPQKAKKDKRYYNKFKKDLTKNGYGLFQKSVYLKYLRNIRYYKLEINKIKKIIDPDIGDIKILPLTINQFNNIENITNNTNTYNIKNEEILHF